MTIHCVSLQSVKACATRPAQPHQTLFSTYNLTDASAVHTTRSTLVVFSPAKAITTLASPAFSALQVVVATALEANFGLAGVHTTMPAGVDVTVAALVGAEGGGMLTARMRSVLLWSTVRRVALTEVTRAGAPTASK